jgi:hypothetical protein
MDTKSASLDNKKTELINVMVKAGNRVISYTFIQRLKKNLHLSNNFLSSIIAVLVVSILLWVISWIIDRIVKLPITWLEALYLAIPAIVTGIFLLMAKVGVDVAFLANIYFIADFCKNEKGFIAMSNWFKKTFIIWPQMLFSILIGIIGVISLRVFLTDYPSIRSIVGIYIGAFFSMGIIGMGTYLILVIPTVISLGSKYEMNVYPLDPAQSRLVQVVSYMFGICTLLVSVMATIIMILLFVLNPWGDTTKWVALVWMIYIWGATSYIFFLPHYFLRKGIIFSKNLVLKELDSIICDYQSRIKSLKKSEWESFTEVISLREKVAATKNSPIKFGGWTQYITSLVLPTLSYIGGFVDVNSFIKNLFV